MSNEPSFEAACRTLEDMFPDLDPIVVRSVLDAKDGNVNEATTKLLAMSRSKRGGGGMSSSSGGGGGGGGEGYGDAPRSESMANGGEEINPYTKDARYDDDDDDDDDDRLSTLFFFARPPSSRTRERRLCSRPSSFVRLRSMRENARPGHDATSNPRQNARHRVAKNVSRGNSRPSRAFERIRASSRADVLRSSRFGLMLPFGPQMELLCGRKRARARPPVDFYYRSKETIDDD